MTPTILNQYHPNFISPPGETLLETLQEREISLGELAAKTGTTEQAIAEIINGKAAITPEIAIQLERVLGVPARFWNNRERHYREYLATTQQQAIAD